MFISIACDRRPSLTAFAFSTLPASSFIQSIIPNAVKKPNYGSFPSNARTPGAFKLRMTSQQKGHSKEITSKQENDIVENNNTTPSASNDINMNDTENPSPEDSEENEGRRNPIVAIVALLIAALLGVLLTVYGGNLSKIFADITNYFDKLDPFQATYLYGTLYYFLELIAVPALPLTLGSGYLFGLTKGTILVSISSTLAASTAFTISRYFLKDTFARIALRKYPKFKNIDRAISKQGLKVIFLLRLSPLLPFSISNYIYGLSSVSFWQFTLASWAGMLPGSFAYVSAGAAVNAVSDLSGAGALDDNTKPILLGLGVVATLLVLGLVGNIAKNAIDDVQDEDEEGNQRA